MEKSSETVEKQNRNTTEKNRRERGPKYYRWNVNKKQYELRKPYEFGDDPQNPEGKIVPLGLKNLLIEQNRWQEYVDYFENKNIPIRVFDDLPKNKRKTVKNKSKSPVEKVQSKSEELPISTTIRQTQKNREQKQTIGKRKTIRIVPQLKSEISKKTDDIDENKNVSITIPGLPLGSPKEEEVEEAPVAEEEAEEAPVAEEEVEEAPTVEEEVEEAPVAEEEVEPKEIPTAEEEVEEEPATEEESEPTEEESAEVNPLFSAYKKSDFLYPELDDPEFIVKIAKHKEFFDTKYDGKIYDIKTQADILCNSEFELLPHQIFVKNFMSFNTPYNSLLMYFGLGSGKTCAAIGVAEETRVHMKQIGMRKSIFIVASPNVQDNFRLQLFDETKLKLENGIWSIQSCVGEALLSEINPTYLKSLTKERIINQIKFIISEYYVFMGYTQFANFIQDSTEVKGVGYSREEKAKIKKQKIKSVFNNRLIIIDEVHNIRITTENKNKKTAELLMEVAKQADNMRLLLLSATPMYNSHEEIVWLINLMNLNDKRTPVKISEIFNKNGEFHVKSEKHPEDGRDILIRKLTGYVSYVRGENPYSFPFRVYPTESGFNNVTYPTLQMNGKPLDKERAIKHIPIYLHRFSDSSYQSRVYDFMIQHMRKNSAVLQNDETETTAIKLDSFGYIALQSPLEALNMVYPFSDFENQSQKSTPEEYDYLISNMVGSRGLFNTMSFKETSGEHAMRYNYEYKNLNNGRIFSPENIGKYSVKIAKICEIIKKSKGIVLIYSQWIDAGLVPIALALEEMGFARYGSESYTKSLFKDPPMEPVDALTMKSKTDSYSDTGSFRPARYVMITGDPVFSPNNDADLKYLNLPKNKEGEFVKVVLISRAAGEGVDFKNIRQIHVMEPWFNMSRIEQIIGRGVRNLSHCQLPFEQRNVEIYLHGTQSGETETADLYVYRLAEKKAMKIGKVTRVLKETAVDCILNIAQTNFTAEKLKDLLKSNVVKIETASGEALDYEVGDKPFTEICDYMDDCNYKCSPDVSLETIESQLVQTTYNEEFLQGNRAKIVKRIRDLFRDVPGQDAGKYFFKEDELIRSINIVKEYPLEQIYAALTFLIDSKNEYLIDRYGRLGRLINHGDYYAFQPIEITDEKASIYDRSRPVDNKSHGIVVELPEKRETKDVTETTEEKEVSGEPAAKESPQYVGVDSAYETVMKEVDTNYQLALLKDVKVTAGEKNWYKNMSMVIQHLIEQHGISLEDIHKYVVYHILDEFPLSKKMAVLNRVYSANWKPIENVDTYMKEYFDERVVVTDRGLLGITLSDGASSPKIFIQSPSEIWKEAEFTESNTILRSNDYGKKHIFTKDSLSQNLGFMSWVDGQEEYVFKIRDLNDGVNKRGARVSQALSKDLLTKINAILGEPMYTTENVKTFFGEGKNRLAVILECLIREFQREKKEDKNWFLTNEQVLLNGILKYSRKN